MCITQRHRSSDECILMHRIPIYAYTYAYMCMHTRTHACACTRVFKLVCARLPRLRTRRYVQRTLSHARSDEEPSWSGRCVRREIERSNSAHASQIRIQYACTKLCITLQVERHRNIEFINVYMYSTNSNTGPNNYRYRYICHLFLQY